MTSIQNNKDINKKVIFLLYNHSLSLNAKYNWIYSPIFFSDFFRICKTVYRYNVTHQHIYKLQKKGCSNIMDCELFIGYYTVDCTIPTYIWTSAQMTTILVNTIHYVSHLGTSPIIFRYWTVNCIITVLLYIQLFKENATFKLQFVFIVLPCITKLYRLTKSGESCHNTVNI